VSGFRFNRPQGFGGAGSPLSRMRPDSPLVITAALTAAFAVLLGFYLFVPNAIVFALLIALAAGGVDRLLRLHPQARFHGAAATLLYLFVPCLFAAGAALFLEQRSDGFANVLWAVVGALVFGLTANLEYLTIDPDSEAYELARLGLLLVVYLVAFWVFAVAFTSGLPLLVGVLVVAGTAFLLTVDILRELETETAALLWQAGAMAFVMAEVRVAVSFLPLGELLAGAFLLITFYVATGLLQNLITGRLDRRGYLQYGTVATVGLAFVLVARLATG
jgi:hypothetical protein